MRGCSQTALTTKEAISGAINVRVNQASTQQTKPRETTVPLLPTTHGHLGSPETRGQNTNSLALPTTESKQRKETVPTRNNTDKNNQAFNKSKGSVSDSNGENKSRVIKAVSLSMVILIAIVVIAKRKKLAEFFKWARCRPICRCSDIERGGETESSVLDDINAQLAMNVNVQLATNVKAMGCKHIPPFYFPIQPQNQSNVFEISMLPLLLLLFIAGAVMHLRSLLPHKVCYQKLLPLHKAAL